MPTFRVSDLVQNRLVSCGWKDQIRLQCRKILETEDIRTVEELVDKVTPKARSLIPDSVKRELLHELEVFNFDLFILN